MTTQSKLLIPRVSADCTLRLGTLEDRTDDLHEALGKARRAEHARCIQHNELQKEVQHAHLHSAKECVMPFQRLAAWLCLQNKPFR